MPFKCNKCRSAVAEVFIPYARLRLCPDCFSQFYIARVKRTVDEYKMFGEKDSIGVALSGGKDSAALLHALKHAYPNFDFKSLHVNLGIPEYSSHCQMKVEKLTANLGVELHIFDLRKELGISLDDFKKTQFKHKICSVCGTIKRHVFEELAQKLQINVLATGHNLNDMAAVMFKNFIYGRWEQLVRLKPVLHPQAEGMTRKVKPLIKSPENENLLYCLYNEIPFREIDCIFSLEVNARKDIKLLEVLAKDNPHLWHQMLNRFLEIIPMLESKVPKKPIKRCQNCGFPSAHEICAYCKRISIVRPMRNLVSEDAVKP